jgi:hypothetical protein
MAQAAIVCLKIIGWLILLSSVVAALLYMKGAIDLIPQTPAADVARGLTMVIVIATLLGGIFLWALCIVVASIADSLLQTVDLLRYGSDIDDTPAHSVVRRVPR